MPIALLRGNSPQTNQKRGVISVDAKNGIIRNVAVMTAGPAAGHGFCIDEQTLDEFMQLAGDSLRCRFGHPELNESLNQDGEPVQSIADDIGAVIGTVCNLRREG